MHSTEMRAPAHTKYNQHHTFKQKNHTSQNSQNKINEILQCIRNNNNLQGRHEFIVTNVLVERILHISYPLK